MSARTIAQIGEFTLIDQIEKMLPSGLTADLLTGIGDDTAVLDWRDGRAMLITCDIQIENQHFRRQHISFEQLGRRAMTVNLSDIAAMGGTPRFALVSLGLPDALLETNIVDLYQGMQAALAPWNARIIGGNMSRSQSDVIIDITMIGEALATQVIRRSGANPGDHIWISGFPGVSAAGFQLLEHYGNRVPTDLTPYVRAHQIPIARNELGQALATCGFVTAMIDISDGIAGDLNHVCERSGVGALLHETKLPVPPGFQRVSELVSMSGPELALHGGEDYELLFTVAAGTPAHALVEIGNALNISLTSIG